MIMIQMNPSHCHIDIKDSSWKIYSNETHIAPLDVASNWALLFKVLEVLLFSGTLAYSNLRESRVKVIAEAPRKEKGDQSIYFPPFNRPEYLVC
jgi:hypothetical protein